VGIFIADPASIYVKKEQEFDAGGHKFKDVAATGVSLAEVFATFPRQPLFTMGPAGLVEIPRIY